MTVQFGRALVMGVLSTVFVLTGVGTAAAGETSSFRVEESQVDAGTVTGGKPVTATFVFHNDSDLEVHILKAAPS